MTSRSLYLLKCPAGHEAVSINTLSRRTSRTSMLLKEMRYAVSTKKIKAVMAAGG